MKILLATSNPHKLSEISEVFTELRALPRTDEADTASFFAPPSIELIDLRDLPETIQEPVEDGSTFEANAELKAVHYASRSGHLCLADDSGLVVDALDGEPGVRSARFAGVTGPRPMADQANNALLLKKLEAVPASRRTARFVCAMVLCGPAGGAGAPPVALARATGTVEGRILGPGDEGYGVDNPRGRGAHGFGYDPLFVLPESGMTTAELSSADKNRISHRGRAARRMWKQIVEVISDR